MEQKPSWRAHDGRTTENLVHAFIPLSLPTLILSFHVRLGLSQVVSSLQIFSTRIFCGCLIFPIPATCPAYFICLEWSPVCNIKANSTVMKLLLAQHFSFSWHFLTPTSRFSSQHPVNKQLSLRSLTAVFLNILTCHLVQINGCVSRLQRSEIKRGVK